jgi:hypothetical protein
VQPGTVRRRVKASRASAIVVFDDQWLNDGLLVA